jgi:hypothetical protein
MSGRCPSTVPLSNDEAERCPEPLEPKSEPIAEDCEGSGGYIRAMAAANAA